MKKRTKKISEIKANDCSSWSSNVFLTFDTDWVKDFILEETVKILDTFGLYATFFTTGKSDLIKDIGCCPKFEVGIHPNFNPLLFETKKTDTAVDIIAAMREDFPEAISVRSHSLTHNERLLDLFFEHELKNICNQFLPLSENIELHPFFLWDDLQLIPHRFQDNVQLKTCLPKPIDLISSNGLLVFNFHPIHLYLNTFSLKHYEDAKPFYHDKKSLSQHRYEGNGLRTEFIKLCERLS